MWFTCRCGEKVSDHASPAPQEFVVRRTGEEAAERRWAAAAAGYVADTENGRRDSWLAEHFPHLPDASHEDVMSLLADYLLPEQQVDIICPHCGRLWRQCEPGEPAQRSFLPEEDQGLAVDVTATPRVRFSCRCGKVVSTGASPAPRQFTVTRDTDREAADDRWAAAAAGYVKAAQNGRRGSWLAEHCPHLPEASHEQVLSGLLADHILTYHQVDIICPQCGRLWRQDEPGGPAHRSFLPEEDLARVSRLVRS